MKEIKILKDPRVMVSVKRHTALSKKAKKRGLTIAEVAEEKFKSAK